MKLNLSLLFSLFFICSSYSQLEDYPKGIYETFQDFKIRIPNKKDIEFNIKRSRDTIWYKFYDAKTKKRLKKEFAYSDGNDLYVSLKEITKKFLLEDSSQLKDDGNYCLKAEKIGKKYIYFESYFTSRDASLYGGFIGASVARRIKGIVYNVEKGTFNLFKNAEDFENFIKENHPEYLKEVESTHATNSNKKSKRKKKRENIDLIRKIIDEVYDK